MARILLRIGGTDFTDYLSEYEDEENVLVKDEGRNARGDLRITILNRKAKVYTTFRPLNDIEMQTLRTALKSFVLSVTYYNSETGTTRTTNMYVGTGKSSLLTTRKDSGLYKPFSINFIEL